MADYIIEPLDTDAETIFQDFTDYVRVIFPDWEASEGQLDVIIARYFAMQTAFTADMASRVERAIFRYFGASLAGIPPLPGSAATATVSFVIDDPSEVPVTHTMEFGTLVGLTDQNGDLQMFALLEDMVVPAGDLTSEVDVQAIEIGAVSNNITGTVELIEQTDWIGSASVVGASSGGSDPEEDDTYIQRLTENLALMAPRPILANDFAIFAQNVPGVWRAAVVDNFRPGNNEKQTITSNFTGGIWAATFLGQETPALPATATAAQFRDAMIDLPNFDITDGDFAGGPLPGTPLTITFKGKYGYTNMAAITVNTASLTGGSSMTVTQTVNGTAYATDLENSIAISAVDEAGNPLPTEVRQQLIDYLESTRPQNFLITFVDPAYHTVDINYIARALRGQDAASVRTAADISFMNYLDPAQWGVYPFQSNNRIWVLQPNIRYLELTTVLENTPGLDYTESLTFSLDGSAFTTSDKTFAGAFSLTRPGTLNGTINLPI